MRFIFIRAFVYDEANDIYRAQETVTALSYNFFSKLFLQNLPEFELFSNTTSKTSALKTSGILEVKAKPVS